MREQVVRPGEGIDPVRLGTGLAEARAALAPLGDVEEFRRTPDEPPGLTVRVGDQSVFVEGSDGGVVTGVEVSGGEDVAVLLDGLDVFRTPAERLVTLLGERHEVVDADGGYTYELPGLSVALWRGSVPDEDDEEPDGEGTDEEPEGVFFESVRVGD